ncbi:MAG: hypothetical protein V2B19_00520 [Pseudomonadota bacterium]
MANKKRCFLLGICLFFSLSCAVSHGGPPAPSGAKAPDQRDVAILLEKLTSPMEADRYQAVEAAKRSSGRFTAQEVESALTQIRGKNVSALIFFFMESRNDILYRLGVPARMTLENSPGSFPNIAFYYARVRPPEGLKALLKLYETHEDQKMAICKAIGETGSPDGAAFLMRKAEQAEKAGSRIPMLAGLKVLRQTVDKTRIASFLNADLDREEIILLSQLKTDFSGDELISLYNGNNRQRAYALEYIFMAPEKNVAALQSIINEMMERKQFDRVRELLMSDRIRSSADERIRGFRESVLQKIPVTTNG